MIVVTGGAGFIGSNLVKFLNQQGHQNILVVDDLTDGTKFRNIADCQIEDYLDKKIFLEKISQDNYFSSIKVIFHQGACSDTTEWNGQFMMENNYEYSKKLFHFTQKSAIPFIYASSASVYGNGDKGFKETLECEHPLNMYAYSKYLFDQYIRRFISLSTSQIMGFRYFNVYGPREQHKGKMASVAFHFNQQLLKEGKVKLFEGSGGYANGEQRRDFLYVEDVVKVLYWAWQEGKNGIYNLGTGRSQSFNDVAKAVIDYHGKGQIEYVPFPESLRNAYQSFTQADITALRGAGYLVPFKTVEEGVKEYLKQL